MSVSKKLRFEVFKRDKFTCQYCGKKAPDVVLHADHVEPKAKGGKNTLLNLVTACADCNLGKGARQLADDSAVNAQRRQLEELQAKQEQIAMMVQWQRSLLGMESQELAEVEKFWNDLIVPYAVNEHGLKDLKKLLRKYGLQSTLEAIRISVERYINVDESGQPDLESVNLAFGKIGGILHIREAEKEAPWLREVFYIRGIIRKRFNYVDGQKAKEMLDRAFRLGANAPALRNIALSERNWTGWKAEMQSYIEYMETECGEDDA